MSIAIQALHVAIADFEKQLQQLAASIAASIVRDELARRRASEPPKRRGRPPGSGRKKAAASAPMLPGMSVTSVPAAPAATAPAGPGRPSAWTRDSIIAELSKYFANKTQIDASFISRHGPRGLVGAARRVFGRFDAALNVAALHWSQQQAAREDAEADAAQGSLPFA